MKDKGKKEIKALAPSSDKAYSKCSKAYVNDTLGHTAKEKYEQYKSTRVNSS